MLSKIDPNRDMREDSVILKDGNEIDIAWDWEDDDIDPRNDFELRVFKIRFDEEPWQEVEGTTPAGPPLTRVTAPRYLRRRGCSSERALVLWESWRV